jgi:antitoxin MazE
LIEQATRSIIIVDTACEVLMQTQTRRWGNSLAVRIPKAFAEELGLSHGTLVDMTIEEGEIVIRRLPQEKITLHALLDGVTDDNIHGEVESSGPVGVEIW